MSDNYAKNLAELVASRVARVDAAAASGPSEAERGAAIDALTVALAGRRRARLRGRVARGLGVFAAAAVLVLVGSALVSRPHASTLVLRGHPTEGTQATLSDGTKVPLVDGVPVLEGSRIDATYGRVDLSFATGTELSLESHGEVSVVGAGKTQAFRLDRGRLSAHVAKLGEGERFVVRTGDTEVEVRGTRFVVELGPKLACAGGTETRVTVSEGVVVVRSQGTEARVQAGESWPACTDPTPPAPPSVVRSASAAPSSSPSSSSSSSPHAPEAKVVASAAREPAEAPPSSLAEENALFQAGLAQKRAGDAPSAVATFETLVRKHPKSPLAESAHVERMRLLANHRDPRARAAAKEYLARYPKGYARGEAMDLVGP
jgi:ferric-dicitrate binding protein FerR (iron transport regulator)